MNSAKPATVELKNQKISLNVLKLLPIDFIKRHNVLPLEIKHGKLCVAMSDPRDPKTVSEVQSITGYELIISEANAESILEALERHLKAISEAAYCKDLDLRDSTQDVRTSQTVDRLFELALDRRASDIHLEPQAGGLFVRLRIDGVLHTIHEFPKAVMPAILSRVKIMASMDIAEKR